MGYGGKTAERQRARELRAESWTLQDIAEELGVAKSSVSRWVRDVDFEPRPRNRGHPSQRPHPLTVRKEAEIAQCRVEAERVVGALDERDLTMFCLALYAGEGSKTTGSLKFANSDACLMRVFIAWLRSMFEIDESRLRMRLYLHADLDLSAATSYWSRAMDIPVQQFTKPHRAVPDATRRLNRHVNGCATVVYNSSRTQRRVMAMIEAVTSPFASPG